MANTGFRINPTQEAQVITVDYATMASFPSTGNPLLFYKDLSDGTVYQWQSSAYVEIDPAIDAGGELVEETGNPQLTRSTPLSSPDYRVLNTTACPIDSGDEIYLNMTGSYLYTPDNKFVFDTTLSDILADDLLVDFSFTYKDDGITKDGGEHAIVINSGELEATVDVPNDFTIGTITDIMITITTVSPNPNGTKTIIY